MIAEIDRTTTTPDAEDEWLRAGLRVVDASATQRIVAFRDSIELDAFLRRLGEYEGGPSEGRRNPPHLSFFDGIISLRPYGPEDRASRSLRESLVEQPERPHLVDVELWYPGSAETAVEWMTAVSESIRERGGTIVDSLLGESTGLVLLRMRAPGAALTELLEADVVAEMDEVTIAPSALIHAGSIDAQSLPELPSPDPDVPLVGVIDTGIQAAHPIMAGTVYDALAIETGEDGADRHGHGTAAASVVVWGDIAASIGRHAWQTPHCSVLSVKVLDRQNQLPSEKLPEKQLAEAIRVCAAQGARIINLSLGDLTSPLRGRGGTRLASVIDSLARELDLVIVMPTGEISPGEYRTALSDDFAEGYIQQLYDYENGRVLDPAHAAIALTVGGTVAADQVTRSGIKPIGKSGWPSPISRRGPGINGALKPELSAPAGTLAPSEPGCSSPGHST